MLLADVVLHIPHELPLLHHMLIHIRLELVKRMGQHLHLFVNIIVDRDFLRRIFVIDRLENIQNLPC